MTILELLSFDASAFELTPQPLTSWCAAMRPSSGVASRRSYCRRALATGAVLLLFSTARSRSPRDPTPATNEPLSAPVSATPEPVPPSTSATPAPDVPSPPRAARPLSEGRALHGRRGSDQRTRNFGRRDWMSDRASMFSILHRRVSTLPRCSATRTPSHEDASHHSLDVWAFTPRAARRLIVVATEAGESGGGFEPRCRGVRARRQRGALFAGRL